jgi:hypothetical protein
MVRGIQGLLPGRIEEPRSIVARILLILVH